MKRIELNKSPSHPKAEPWRDNIELAGEHHAKRRRRRNYALIAVLLAVAMVFAFGFLPLNLGI